MAHARDIASDVSEAERAGYGWVVLKRREEYAPSR